MGGGTLMQEPTRRFSRPSAVRMFAQEYQEASLPEEGSGEYDPSFVITKLGAKINRALVCGVIDRMERREGESGPNYSGHIRDPTGSHLFSVAPFQPELHPDFEELLARFESGDVATDDYHATRRRIKLRLTDVTLLLKERGAVHWQR